MAKPYAYPPGAVKENWAGLDRARRGIAALVAVLERKGLLMQQEVLEEITRMKRARGKEQ